MILVHKAPNFTDTSSCLTPPEHEIFERLWLTQREQETQTHRSISFLKVHLDKHPSIRLAITTPHLTRHPPIHTTRLPAHLTGHAHTHTTWTAVHPMENI